ncbi:hypothetical protein M9Y10_015811 [Tritrichomonas musculus]|uniref:DUF3447 domain-containing protein n=1 Tax=Tritrichomonas musculus TaxID=1915356 RepID=A0ABR2I4Y3_9EUKA
MEIRNQEEIQEYIDKKKLLQRKLLDFIENDSSNDEENYHNLIKYINSQKIQKDKHELKSLLYLILKISNNHFRISCFFEKIEKILLFLEQETKQTFSNNDIFNIFKNNKKILLFLIEKQFIKIDKSLSSIFILPKYEKLGYPTFFINEIRKFSQNPKIREVVKNEPENCEEKRKIGQNDSQICEIIRDDSLDKFISYVNEKNLPLSSKIERSSFETNPFLLRNEPTLIEYAAFFGSIKIFKYLHENKVDLSKSLWFYSIHGQNIELIHLLENNHIEPEDNTYQECLREAIKCHHNEIAYYIKHNLLVKEEGKDGKPKINSKVRESLYASAIRYYNYAFFDTFFKSYLCLIRYCMYDYYKIVEYFYQNKDLKINYFVVF